MSLIGQSPMRRASIILEISTFRPMLAQLKRESEQDAKAAKAHRERSWAAEIANDGAVASFHLAAARRLDRMSREAYEQRAVMLEAVRALEKELARC